jgi:hypothetical protein
MLHEVPHLKDVWRSGDIVPVILRRGTRYSGHLNAPTALPKGKKPSVVMAGYFSLHHRVQKGSGAHQPSIQWVRGTLSLGVKRPGREADHSLSSNAEVKKWRELYIHSPTTPSWRGAQLKQRQIYLTHWIGDWVVLMAGLDSVARRKKSQPLPGIEPRSSSPAIPAPQGVTISNLIE